LVYPAQAKPRWQKNWQNVKTFLFFVLETIGLNFQQQSLEKRMHGYRYSENFPGKNGATVFLRLPDLIRGNCFLSQPYLSME